MKAAAAFVKKMGAVMLAVLVVHIMYYWQAPLSGNGM